MGRRPWFPFYVGDWDGDEAVKLMNNRERGAYLRLLIHQWREGSLPDDVSALATLAGEPPRVFERMWAKMDGKFPVTDTGRRCNPRMAAEIAKADDLSQKRADAARQRGG